MHESHHILDIKKKQVETNLGSLSQQVKNAIAEAMNCLTSHDLSYCDRLVRNDLNLNELRRIIEQDCLVAIASQQPVANDLRDIVADMRIAAELERMGDYASDIASSILRMDEAGLESVGLEHVLDMSLACRQMLMDAMQAHKAGDTALARQVGAMDDALDGRMSAMVTLVLDAMRGNPALVNNGSRMLWIAHNLERCGDRATNIAEQVVFRVEGTIEELD
ncbi:MAG: phosphate signaling complex protein PhoU [Thiobacillus sp.]|nr:phosphate signaling complex protein PhoU [Thiobacillus sp.]